MKNRFAVLFLVMMFFFVGSALAQDTGKSIWTGGFLALTYNDFYGSNFGLSKIKSGEGYSVETTGSNDLSGNYWGVGINLGASGYYALAKYFGLRADLDFAVRRGSGKSDMTVKLNWDDKSKPQEKSDLELKMEITQLNFDLPITARLIVPDIAYLEAGPMASLNVYSKTKLDIKDIYGKESYDDTNDFNTFEFAVVTGIGIIRNINKSVLDINLRLVLGLTEINESSDSPKTWQVQLMITNWLI